LVFQTDIFQEVFPPKFSMHSLSPIPSQWPAHYRLLYFDVLTILDDMYKSQRPSLCNILNCSLTSSFLDSNIFLSILFSNTCNLYSFLKARDHISHLYNE
jgi:hypothetical protein